MELVMLEWLWTVRADFQHIYAVILCIAVFRWGASPERILMGTFMGMLVLDQTYHALAHGSIFWHQLNLGHLILDCLLFAIFVPVALRANRVYPLWIGGAQIISLSAHVYRLSLTEINRFAYDVMSVMPSYIQLTALTLGLAFHMWRRKKLGNYPSWRSSFSPTPAPRPRPSPAD